MPLGSQLPCLCALGQTPLASDPPGVREGRGTHPQKSQVTAHCRRAHCAAIYLRGVECGGFLTSASNGRRRSISCRFKPHSTCTHTHTHTHTHVVRAHAAPREDLPVRYAVQAVGAVGVQQQTVQTAPRPFCEAVRYMQLSASTRWTVCARTSTALSRSTSFCKDCSCWVCVRICICCWVTSCTCLPPCHNTRPYAELHWWGDLTYLLLLLGVVLLTAPIWPP